MLNKTLSPEYIQLGRFRPFFFFFFNFILFFKLYIIVLVLPNIKMNLPHRPFFSVSILLCFPELGILNFSGEFHKHQRPFLEALQSLYSPNEHGSGRHVVPDTTVQMSKGPMVKKDTVPVS